MHNLTPFDLSGTARGYARSLFISEGLIMSEEEKIIFLLEKVKEIALENSSETTSAIEAIKQAINYVEGSFKGY